MAIDRNRPLLLISVGFVFPYDKIIGGRFSVKVQVKCSIFGLNAQWVAWAEEVTEE